MPRKRRAFPTCVRRPFFGGLPLLGDDEVLVHHLARALDVADAQRVVDRAVHLGRFAQVAGPARGLATLLVEERRDHLDERREYRISGRSGDRPMKADVVAKERVRLFERRVHAGDLLGDAGEMLAGGALGGEAGDADFEHAPRFEHFVARKSV